MAESWQEIGSAEMWNYKELGQGAVLVGTYLTKEEDVGENHSNVYNIEKEDGTLMGTWGNTVLDTKFKQVVPGEMVRIEYMGMADGKNGRSYHDFKVSKKPAPFKEVEDLIDGKVSA